MYRPLDDVLEHGRRLDMSSIVDDQLLTRCRGDLRLRVKLRIMVNLVNRASWDFYVRS